MDPATATSRPSITLIADGDTVAVSGRVVSVPGKPVRLCGPEVNDLVGYAPGHQPASAWCPLGVDVTGVNLAKLSDRRSKAGATEGYAYLRGTYRTGTIAVSLQASPRYESARVQDLTRPPCATPAGGWTKIAKAGNPDAAGASLQKYLGAHRETLVSIAVFRPTPTSAVLVVAAEHPDLVRAALPDNPAAFCVIRSRYTREQITAARAPWEADLRRSAGKTGGLVSAITQGVGPDGQVTVDAEVLRVTPAVESWLAVAPAGLVQRTSWLQPVAADAPLLPPQPSGSPSPFVTDQATARG